MNQEVVSEKNGCYIPKRYIFVVLGFFGFFNVYAMMVNLSVAMIAMVNSTEEKSVNYSAKVMECAVLQELEDKTSGTQFKAEQYYWDPRTQGMVLGAFFYGYTITQVPGGFLSEKIGAKWMFGGGVFFTSVLTLLTPLAARSGTAVLIVVRILEGLGEGVTFPAMNFIISEWAPLQERSRVSTIIFIGALVGNVIAMPISGLLSSTDLFGGWPSVFYVFGTIGCIWFILWSVLVHESPRVHPTISNAELAYFQQYEDALPQKKTATPWKAIFTSMPMWATLVAHLGDSLGLFIYMTELPNYLSSILHFNIKKNGALSALPYIVQAVVASIASCVADRLRLSGMLSITSIRKIFNTLGSIGPAICLLCVTVSGCRPQLIMGLLTLAMALNGLVYSGFNVTHIDMSPDFAGTLYGITNTFGNLCGIIAPAIVGAFTSDGVTISIWNKVFYITAAAYIGGAIFYALFASAELQPWSRGVQTNSKERKNSSISETRS